MGGPIVAPGVVTTETFTDAAGAATIGFLWLELRATAGGAVADGGGDSASAVVVAADNRVDGSAAAVAVAVVVVVVAVAVVAVAVVAGAGAARQGVWVVNRSIGLIAFT